MNKSSSIIIFAIVCIGHFLVDFMIGIWPVFKTMQKLDLSTAGLIAAASVAVGELMQVSFGSLGDKGYKKLLIGLGILLTSASALFSYGSTYTTYAFLYFITIIGSAAFHPIALSTVGALQLPNKNMITALFTMSGMTGAALSQWSFSTLYNQLYGHTAVLLIPVLLVCLWIAVQNTSEISKPSAQPSHINIKTLLRMFQIRNLRLLYFCMVANQAVFWSFVFLLPDLLLSMNYPDWIVFGGGHFFMLLGAAFAPPIIGYIADKTSERHVLMSIFIAKIVLLYTILTTPNIPNIPLLSLLFSFGAVLGSVPPLSWAYGNAIAPHNRGMVCAFLMGLVWVVSESGGIGVSSVLADVYGPQSAIMYMGIILFFGLWATYQLPENVEEVSFTS